MQALAACGNPQPCRTSSCTVPGVCTNWGDTSSILDLAAASCLIPARGRNAKPPRVIPLLGLLCRVCIRLVKWHGATITIQGVCSSRGSVTMRAISTQTSRRSTSGMPCKMSSPTGPTRPPSSQMCKLGCLCWDSVWLSPNEEFPQEFAVN